MSNLPGDLSQGFRQCTICYVSTQGQYLDVPCCNSRDCMDAVEKLGKQQQKPMTCRCINWSPETGCKMVDGKCPGPTQIEQQTPLMAEEFRYAAMCADVPNKAVDLLSIYQGNNYEQAYEGLKLGIHWERMQTAQLRQDLEQTKARDRAWSMKARQLSTSLEQANLLLEHVKVLNGGMVDAFRGHDYRQMYEIWQTLLSSLEK